MVGLQVGHLIHQTADLTRLIYDSCSSVPDRNAARKIQLFHIVKRCKQAK